MIQSMALPTVLGARRLIAIIHPDNRASRRVAEKIGLRPEKQATVHGGRDAAIYAAALGQAAVPYSTSCDSARQWN